MENSKQALSMDTDQKIAQTLLQIKAIKLSPANPFTWASGWRSPIYCDNRKTLSYPKVRHDIAVAFAQIISQKYPETQLIAGVATGAIAVGVLTAEQLAKPFVYVRPTPKDHGLANQVEGECTPGQKVVVVEDLISTGGSSLKAVEGLRAAGCHVLGMVAIFSYGFAVAQEGFTRAGVELSTLSNYNALMELAQKQGLLNDSDLEMLHKWHLNPTSWTL